MSKFRIALSGDFKKPDGTPAFPDVDLAPLELCRIHWSTSPRISL
jgi:hypothetical protein